MAKDKESPQGHVSTHGYQPVEKGHQPIAVNPQSPGQAGYQPTTGQGGTGPGTPPSQGSSGKK